MDTEIHASYNTVHTYSIGREAMNRLARLLLTASSIAPVCVTLIFIGLMNNNSLLVYISVITAIISWLLCWSLVHIAAKNFEILSKNISSISPANKEVTNYFLSYLFPLLGTDSIATKIEYAIFFYLSLLFYICFSENYNFNPVLALHGYKFYEAEDDTGVGFVLISKKIITDIKNIDFKVVKLTEHTFLHVIG
ncbi:hypothetical protein [Kosakonia cowanii]|uniref:hypothetical protein n=1 Tax=Kosakonia cowanii TaxID=208223 RepID=UPI004064AE16